MATFTPPPPVPDAPSSAGGFVPPPPVPDAPGGPLSAGLRAVKQPMSRVVELLQRGSEAGTAAYERGLGAGAQTLLHSEAQKQYEADTAEISRKWQGLSPQEYAKRPGWERTANEMAVQMLLDPTTYLGGLGLSRMAVEKSTEHVLPAALHAMEKLGSQGGDVGKYAKLVSAQASKAHDYMMGGGKPAGDALRKLAYEKGRAGVQEFHRHYSLRQLAQPLEHKVVSTLNAGMERAIGKLSQSDRMEVFNAIHNGAIEELPENLRNSAFTLQSYLRGAKALAGTNPLRNRLVKQFGLPKDLEGFLTKTPVNSITNKAGVEHGLLSRIRPEDEKDFLQRTLAAFGNDESKMGKGLLPQDPQLVEDMLKSHFARVGSDVKDTHILDRLRDEFGYGRKVEGKREKLPEHIENFYKPEKAAAATDIQRLQDVSKAAMFWSPIGHMARISTLLAAHSPIALGKAMGKFAKMRFGFANEQSIANTLGRAVTEGATGSQNIEKSQLEDVFSKLGTGQIAQVTRTGKPLQALGKGASKWYGGVGKMLWGWDEASKAALFDEYAKMYKRWDPVKKMSVEDPLRAAYHVQQDLVNYGAPSPFIRGAGRALSAFPTWRTRMPIAVTRAIAKHPQVAANLARTMPWLFGQQFDQGGKPRKFYGSALAEGTGAIGLGDEGGYDVLKYGRSSLRPGIKGAFGAGLAGLAQISDPKRARMLGSMAKFWTSGAPVGSYLAQSEIPYVGTAMSMAGKGLFPDDPQSAALFNLLNIGDVQSKAPTRPSVPRPKVPRPGAKKPSGLWF